MEQGVRGRGKEQEQGVRSRGKEQEQEQEQGAGAPEQSFLGKSHTSIAAVFEGPVCF
jgi:hypothetical protein